MSKPRWVTLCQIHHAGTTGGCIECYGACRVPLRARARASRVPLHSIAPISTIVRSRAHPSHFSLMLPFVPGSPASAPLLEPGVTTIRRCCFDRRSLLICTLSALFPTLLFPVTLQGFLIQSLARFSLFYRRFLLSSSTFIIDILVRFFCSSVISRRSRPVLP